MDPKELEKYIRKAGGDRTKLIDSLLKALETVVAASQQKLLQRFINDWVSSLEVDPATGKIKATLKNKRLLSTIDKVFANYVKSDGVAIAKTIVDGVKQIIDFNGKYYKGFMNKVDLIPINKVVVSFMESWLGINGKNPIINGYLLKTVNDPKVLGQLKDFALTAVVGQQGYQDTLQGARDFIDGNRASAGLLDKYVRNFVYDTFSQVDRASAGIYATKLGMDYAIYEGGLIKTSRKFCKEHNGNVYTRDEIMAFDPKEAIPANYNPETDLGGFGCRHHLNWIPYAVAVILRPDLAGNQ